MESPWAPRMKDKVIGLGKPKGNPKKLVKTHENAELEKMVEDAQGKQMGKGCPREK